MKALFDAIYAKFIATPHNDFYTDIGGRFYMTRAIQTATYPYATYHLISDIPDYIFVNDYENCLIQFSIFDTNESAVNVEKYFTDLKTLYDWCTLSVTGYNHIYMKRESSRVFHDGVAWCRSVDYRIYLEKV